MHTANAGSAEARLQAPSDADEQSAEVPIVRVGSGEGGAEGG